MPVRVCEKGESLCVTGRNIIQYNHNKRFLQNYNVHTLNYHFKENIPALPYMWDSVINMACDFCSPASALSLPPSTCTFHPSLEHLRQMEMQALTLTHMLARATH